MFTNFNKNKLIRTQRIKKITIFNHILKKDLFSGISKKENISYSKDQKIVFFWEPGNSYSIFERPKNK